MDLAAIVELDRRFGIPGAARVIEGSGELAKVAINTRASAGEISLHGAHVTSWKPRGAEEVLFVSAKSDWKDARPIRGGIPICFPWFAGKADDVSAPAHGFVRTRNWQLDSIVQTGDAVTVSMYTESMADTRQWWPTEFQLIYRATFGSELRLELVAKNIGTTSVRFEEALHTYFRVGQIQKAQLQGLDTVPYLDKTDVNRQKIQKGSVEVVSETDRIYLGTQDAVELEDRALRRRVRVAKENSRTTVVWNPWIEKAKAMSDFGDDEWKQMVCIETCNVSDFAVELAPGQQHSMIASISIMDMA